MEAGKVNSAIGAYTKALESINGNKNSGKRIPKQQEGILLLLRATAELQRARSHKEVLQTAVQEWNMPEISSLRVLLLQAMQQQELPSPQKQKQQEESDDDDKKLATSTAPISPIALSVLKRLQANGKQQQSQVRKLQYRHGLYQMSLLSAAQDSLRATELLPNYSTSWLRAGELLSQLWRLKESKQYYETALALDETLQESLEPILQDLQRRQDLLDRTRATKEWSKADSNLRLALDVAGENFSIFLV